MSCPICLDPIKTNVNCMVTECGHQFHTNCMLKHVSMGSHGCPLCRSTMVAPSENDEEEDDEYEEDDEETILSDETGLWSNDSDDIRNNPDEIEDYMLRGFRWLFLQYPSEEDDFTMFDGNSMSITPKSLMRVSTKITDEDYIYERDEESLDKEWTNIVNEEEKCQTHVSELEIALKKKKISYNDLLNSYLCIVHPNTYYYNEMNYNMAKATNKIEQELEVSNWT